MVAGSHAKRFRCTPSCIAILERLHGLNENNSEFPGYSKQGWTIQGKIP